MARVVLLVAVIGLGVYAFVAALQAEDTAIRAMPRWLWVAAIVLVPVAGPVAWLLWGRPLGVTPPPEHRPLGPDDDPDFLKRL